MRIGVLFNNRAYKVWHAAPVAFELSRLEPTAEIVLLCAGEEVLSTARRIAAGYPGQGCRTERLALPLAARTFSSPFKSVAAVHRDTILRANLSRIATCDAIIAPDLTALRFLKQRRPGLPFIFTKHGAGDRAQAINPKMAAADFVLVPGRKLERRFLEAGLIRPGDYAVTGYVKLDAVEKVVPDPGPVFGNDRPIVLYNPHFERSLSSWQPWGHAVLDFFARNAERYNLIFAPHLKLFEQWLRHGARLPRRYRNRPNIHIDLGSAASIDMTYTRAADIYLGDVSSQIYEFLVEPRPCLFLDPRGVAWQEDPNYAHWHLGPVVRSLDDLGPKLDRAGADHARYEPAQKRAIAETFEQSDIPAPLVAAQAILDWLNRRRQAGELAQTPIRRHSAG